MATATSRNLVTSLSLHEAGEIWIECEGGTEFHEHSGMLVAGCRFPVQLQTVCFAASKVVHCTCPWDLYDRGLLVAYTPGHWNSLRAPILDRLCELGFHLPTPRCPHPPPQLHLDCLPSVLRGLKKTACLTSLYRSPYGVDALSPCTV